MVEVVKEQCKRIAETIDGVLLPKRYFQKPDLDDQLLEKIGFYLALLCHGTKGKFRGILQGREKKGLEYILTALVELAKESPEALELEPMSKMTGTKLKELLSDALGNAPLADDMTRRGKIIKENAKALLDAGGFEVFKKTPHTVGDLNKILKELPGFKDPIRKKMFLLMGMLNEWNIWKIEDPERIGFSIDYHIIRGAFRTGIIEVTDKKLREKILNQEEITEDENNAIRKKIFVACSYIGGYAGQHNYELGTYLWNLFRSCCPKDEDPCCVACTRPTGCKLCRQYPFEKKTECNFVKVCKGAKDPLYRALVETTVTTEHY